MRRILSHAIPIATSLTLLGCASAHAANCAYIADAEARACCERNVPEQAMLQEIRLTVADERGTLSNLAATLYWKQFEDGRTRARVDLTEPPRQAGTVVLLTERESDNEDEVREPEVVVYKPGERRDRLITVSALSGEMFGTDFSYEDFAHFYGTDPDIDIVRLDDEEHDGRRVVVVQTTPQDAEAAFDRGASYSRIVTRFDGQRCVPMVTQFFEPDDVLRKELIATPAAVRELNGRWVPYELVMYDRVQQSRTVLSLDRIEFDPVLKGGLFARSALKRGR